ncbi:uncharacterized protein BP5553_09872 [Venustampulla echinocandica]|uniref:Aminoglycoside phosphotransferase domain-containing protein n=1 Tax=Venustampulla echinocandica TaxID=2656787 RepID=A0A370TAX1_9HELO|nr:uncharacterized protein BP5553_09872 [Venustampulla echinocandica]RDL31083.1 hypothetical protein BP5553_09872 [Venustampulla echinocandica]
MATSVPRPDPTYSLFKNKPIEQWISEVGVGNIITTAAKPQQSFRDPLVQAIVHRDRDRFIASIRDDDVCRLAALYHNGDACKFFKPPTRGSYNICYFLQFGSSVEEDGDKWVVRVPLAPCLAFGSRSKLESEVATMQLIAEKTTIPIPKIHACALGDDTKPLSSFLMFQYVEGRKLTHADIKILSDEQRTRLILTSANYYITMLLKIADNAFAKDRIPISQEEIHGDLELFNLILDDDMNIISVLDWEWSRVVPCQFFKPPLWLSSSTIQDLSYGYRYKDFLEPFDKFLAILRVLERERFGSELLANEWDKHKQKSGFMAANALENWTAIDWFANRYINSRVYGGNEDLSERIMAFMQADPARKTLIERRLLEAASFTPQLKQLNDSTGYLPDHGVATAAPDGTRKPISTQDYLTRLWKTSPFILKLFHSLWEAFLSSPASRIYFGDL